MLGNYIDEAIFLARLDPLCQQSAYAPAVERQRLGETVYVGHNRRLIRLVCVEVAPPESCSPGIVRPRAPSYSIFQRRVAIPRPLRACVQANILPAACVNARP